MRHDDRMKWFGRLPFLRLDRERESRAVAESALSTAAPALSHLDGTGVARGLKLPRFQSTANDRADTRNSNQLIATQLKLRSAFTPAQPITNPWRFAGRTELLNRLIQAIEDRRLHAILYGVRGIGKTSILHVLAHMAVEAKYRVSYVTCGANASFGDMFRSAADNIPLIFHDDFGPTSVQGERSETLLSLVPDGDITPRLASELCAKITGTRVLIVLDEFDRPSSSAFNHGVAEFIKNLSDRAIRVQLVVAGVAEDLGDLMRSEGIVQRNVVAIQVPRMGSDEIRELIHNGEDNSGISFNPEAIGALTLASAGMPYLASLLSQQAALIGVTDGRLKITESDVAASISEALEEIRRRLPTRVRAFLEMRVLQGASASLGAIASFAYLSGTGVSAERIQTMFPERATAERANAELAGLLKEGILLPPSTDAPDAGVRFRDENELLFLWLLTVRDQLNG